MTKKIGIACDHAAYELKEFLVGYLGTKGFEVVDFGCHSEESVDYPDFAHPLAEAIENGELEIGQGASLLKGNDIEPVSTVMERLLLEYEQALASLTYDG